MKNLCACAVQFNHVPNNKKVNWEKIRYFTKRAYEEGVNLIAFPEMCITGYWHVRKLTREEIEYLSEEVPAGDSTQELISLANDYKMTIGAGLIERAKDGKLYNSYVVAMPKGGFSCHRKLHCFISEFMSSGDNFTVFKIPQGVKSHIKSIIKARY